METGRVEAIFIAAEHGAMPEPVERVVALAGRGLEGDRNFWPGGDARPGRALTLIQREALDGMAEEHGITLEPGASRRQVHTSGVDLNGLVGRRFRVGEVECVGIELCEPCSHLESMTRPGVVKGLVHRGGLNADLLTDGEIAVGDEVRTADD